MDLKDIASIVLFHKSAAKRHGSGSAGALGWATQEAQFARFAVMADIGDMKDKTVLDVGCGHGDLAPFLQNLYPTCKYIGIDQAPAFLDIAIERYGPLPNTSFMLADFWTANLPQADYVLASGALSYRNSYPRFLYDMIAKLFKSCNIGLAFNLLSHLDSNDGLLLFYDMEDVLAYCDTLSQKTELIKGYLPNDFTVWMYK